MTDAAPMAEIFRGEFLESVHVGHAVVARADGSIEAVWGDPAIVILPRSSVKMVQALPLLESGAGDGLSDAQLALACASHSGEERHVALVRAWLADLGLDEHALCCGPQPSRDAETREAMIRAGQPIGRAFNNCSGKHAGFLTLARHLGAGPDYVDPGHPVQVRVRAAFEEMTGEESPGYGIDGCSAPNFACTLGGFATALARFAAARPDGDARDRAAVRLREAMMAHPGLVSGRGRACNEIMTAARGAAAVKTGAEGVFAAILPELGLGIALKVADGATRAAELAIVALLVRLGALRADDPVAAGYLKRPIVNWGGLVTGFERPAPGLLAAA